MKAASTGLDFDCLVFKPMTLLEWKVRYGGVIRISRDLQRIRKAKVGLCLADKNTKMFLVRYAKGDWRDGSPNLAKLGDAPILCRVPAIKIKDHFLIIDGTHRLMLKPKFVVLDYLSLPQDEWAYITDLFNPFWQRMKR